MVTPLLAAVHGTDGQWDDDHGRPAAPAGSDRRVTVGPRIPDL